MGSMLCSQQGAEANGEVETNAIQGANQREGYAAAPQPEEDSYSLPTEPSLGKHLIPHSKPPKERQLSSGRPVSSTTLQIYEVFAPHDPGCVMTDDQQKDLESLRLRLQTSTLVSVDSILFEGELLRYKPSAGMERYVKRWGVLTSEKFMYYKSQLAAMMNDRPLVSLSLKKITSILVYFSHRTKEARFKMELVTTEVISELTELHNYSSRSSGSEQKKEPGHLMPRPLYLLPGSASRSPLTQSVMTALPPLRSGNMSISHRDTSLRTSKVGWTARENEMYRAETRLLFALDSYYRLQQWRLALESVSLG